MTELIIDGESTLINTNECAKVLRQISDTLYQTESLADGIDAIATHLDAHYVQAKAASMFFRKILAALGTPVRVSEVEVIDLNELARAACKAIVRDRKSRR